MCKASQKAVLVQESYRYLYRECTEKYSVARHNLIQSHGIPEKNWCAEKIYITTTHIQQAQTPLNETSPTPLYRPPLDPLRALSVIRGLTTRKGHNDHDHCRTPIPNSRVDNRTQPDNTSRYQCSNKTHRCVYGALCRDQNERVLRRLKPPGC